MQNMYCLIMLPYHLLMVARQVASEGGPEGHAHLQSISQLTQCYSAQYLKSSHAVAGIGSPQSCITCYIPVIFFAGCKSVQAQLILEDLFEQTGILHNASSYTMWNCHLQNKLPKYFKRQFVLNGLCVTLPPFSFANQLKTIKHFLPKT